MWSTLNSASFKLPTKDQIASLYSDGIIPKFKGIIYMSLDFGIIWNPNGKKYPTNDSYGSGWVWCSVDKNYMISYINILWTNKIVPILYGNNINIVIATAVLEGFKVQPPTFLDISLDMLNHSIINQWANNNESNVGMLPLFNSGIKLESGYTTYRLGPESSIGYNVRLEEIGLDPMKYFNDIKTPVMVILMGQNGCGKTTLAYRLEEKGWCVIGDKEATSIRIASSRQNSNVITKLTQLLQSLNSESPPYKGIIIDSVNNLRKDRIIFENLATKNKIPYIVKWITRPGHFYNDKKRIKVTDTILTMYVNNLEIPTEEKWDRLV